MVAVEVLFFFALAGLVLLHLLPEAIQLAGPAAIVLCILSWLMPTALEWMFKKHEHAVHNAPFFVTIVGLILHHVLDGLALATASHVVDFSATTTGLHMHALPIAVVLHTIPAAIFIWWMLKDRYSKRLAQAALLACIIATSVGFFLATYLLGLTTMTPYMQGLFQAIVAGSMLHLTTHRALHSHVNDHRHH